MAATGRGGCVSLRAERSVWRKGGPGPNPGVVFGSFGLATGERGERCDSGICAAAVYFAGQVGGGVSPVQEPIVGQSLVQVRFLSQT